MFSVHHPKYFIFWDRKIRVVASDGTGPGEINPSVLDVVFVLKAFFPAKCSTLIARNERFRERSILKSSMVRTEQLV